MRSHPLRPSERTDWLLSAELALMGPIVTSSERLANRTRSYPVWRRRASGAGSTRCVRAADGPRRAACTRAVRARRDGGPDRGQLAAAGGRCAILVQEVADTAAHAAEYAPAALRRGRLRPVAARSGRAAPKPRARTGRSPAGRTSEPSVRSPEQTAPSRMKQSLGIFSIRPVFSSMIGQPLSLTRNVRPQYGSISRSNEARGCGPLVERGLDLGRRCAPARALRPGGPSAPGRRLRARAVQRQRLEQSEAGRDLHNETAHQQAEEAQQAEVAVAQLAPVLRNVGCLQLLRAFSASVAWQRQTSMYSPPLAHGPRARLGDAVEPATSSVTRSTTSVVVDAAKPGFLPVELARRLTTAVGRSIATEILEEDGVVHATASRPVDGSQILSTRRDTYSAGRCGWIISGMNGMSSSAPSGSSVARSSRGT